MSAKGEELKRDRAGFILSQDDTEFIRFKGAAYVRAHNVKKEGEIIIPATGGFVPLELDWFANYVYRLFGLGVSKASIGDLHHAVTVAAPNWSDTSHLIGFGDGRVWNAHTLDWDPDATRYVYETRFIPQPAGSPGYLKAKTFLEQLSLGDFDLAYDYQQAIAPLFMSDRPTGILWFLGDGANGKSALMSALYRCFAPFFTSLNTAQLEDGKALPALSGKLGNIVQEGSEARIEEASNYKLIGTHQPLSVRKLYTQDMITVSGDFHTIFNANNIPTFADKTDAVRRRTWTIPFPAHFKDDPTFEQRTFTDEFLGGLLTLALEAAAAIRAGGNKYEWSQATLDVKKEYDDAVNSAEAFVGYLIDRNIQGVYNFGCLQRNYHYWCENDGHNELTRQSLKRTIGAKLGMNTKTVRLSPTSTAKRLLFDEAYKNGRDLTWEEGTGYAVYAPTDEAVKQLELEEQEEERQW